jgi:hypothetical protein
MARFGKAIAVSLAVLLLVGAQCFAACVVQPCHSSPGNSASVHRQAAKPAKSSPCHQSPANPDQGQPSDCSHPSLTSDAAKKTAAQQSPLLHAVEFIHYQLPDIGVARLYTPSESLIPSTVTIASSSVLRI